MAADQEFVNDLIANPRESLTVEIKDWIDPRSAHGRAKIVRACIAMRNQNGGFLQVGFENGTWLPNVSGAPVDVRSRWDADEVQALVSRYASEVFEVHLRFGERDGQEFPVLEVERGVRSPVAAKRELTDPNDASRKLVKNHAVYVRSLDANGTASTSEAKHGDWAELTRRCFDNLEADVGRFARRHLGSIGPEAARALAEALVEVMGARAPAGSFAPPPAAARVIELLRDGHERFRQQRLQRNLTRMPQHGALEVGAIIDGSVPGGPPTAEFLNRLNAANPRYTSWPLWLDSRSFRDRGGDDLRPYTFQGGWETFLYNYEPGSPYNHLDFWRAEPAGRFYHYRGFEDDISEGRGRPEAMTTLDFGATIWRVTEAMGTAMAFARAMGLDPEGTTLLHAFRWSGLRGRRLSSWANLRKSANSHDECRQDVVESQPVAVPLDTPTSALGFFVREATADFFAAFGGFEPGKGVTEALADELLVRRYASPEEFYARYPSLAVGHAVTPGDRQRGFAPFGSDEMFVEREWGSPIEGDWMITLAKANGFSHPYWIEDEEPVIGAVIASNQNIPEIRVLAADIDLRPIAKALRRLLPSGPSLEEVSALVKRITADR